MFNLIYLLRHIANHAIYVLPYCIVLNHIIQCHFIPYHGNKLPFFYLHYLTFFRYPDAQTTEKLWLVAGKSYYMKGLIKEGEGGDHLSVGVRYPDGKFDRPISKNIFLSPGKNTT